MVTKIGIYALLAGFFMALFSGISSFMETKNFWVGLSLSKVIGEDNSESIITLIDSSFVQNSLDVLIYELPLFSLIIGLGLILLIVGLFVKEH